MKPFCFVLMPPGVKPGPSGGSIDFDSVYRDLLRPAIEAAGLEAARAEGEIGASTHGPMFDRFQLCEFAIADLTTANAMVFYELGVRHAVRPHTTISVFAEGQSLQFDLGSERSAAYKLDHAGLPIEARPFVEKLTGLVEEAKVPVSDTRIEKLLGDWPELSHTKTDVFRDRVRYDADIKDSLSRARSANDHAAVHAVEAQLGPLDDVETAVVVDLLLSYRAVDDTSAVIALVERMPPILASQTLVREQYGFALNREQRRDEAEAVLTELIAGRGPSPETCAVLGRVYKDRSGDAEQAGDAEMARRFLDRSIDTYLLGFEADWRDAYPGINALRLINERDPHDPRSGELHPVVEYAVRRKIATGAGDYWDHATLVELAVLAGDETAARDALTAALTNEAEPWMFETTADTLARLVAHAAPAWVGDLEHELRAAARR